MGTHLILKLLVIAASIFGFWVSVKIHKEKKTGKPFVCPLNFDCHTVTSSNYSKLFWIPLEYYGMLYYGLMILSYSVLAIAPHWASDVFTQSVIVLSIAAFVFSAFLTWVQAVRIKEWCSWCLVSACLCTSIIVLVVFIYMV